jgi:O-antigen ligase/Flp pilus assembly protein TadD
MFSIRNLKRAVQAGVYLCLLTPLAYFSQTIFGAVFGKMIFFQTIVEITLPFYLCLMIFCKEYRPRFNWLNKSILFFFAVIFISAIFGVDFQKSFWGYDERMRGIFSLLHFAAFYLFIISSFTEEQDRRRLILAAMEIGAIVGVLGIYEFFNPAVRIDRSTLSPRVVSTTGNAIFLAGYMIFITALSFYYFLSIRSKSRWFGAAMVVLSVIVIFYTGTRAALLGLGAGVAIFFAAQIIIVPRRTKMIYGGILLALAALLASAFIFNFSILKQNKLWDFSRIFSISAEDSSSQERLMLWRASVDAGLRSPFFGWGPENYDYAFDAYYNPQFLRYGFTETWADRAHNFYLDWFVMSGLFGLAAYLLIFVAAGFLIVKKIKRGGRENSVLLAGLVAYQVFGIFSVDDPTTTLSWFFFLAVTYLLWDRGKPNAAQIFIQPGKTAFVILALAVCPMIYIYNLRPFFSGVAFIDYRHTADAATKQALAEKFLADNNPYVDGFRLRFGNEAFLEAGTMWDKSYVKWELDRAAQELSKASMNHPRDFSYPLAQGNIYLRRGAVFSSFIDLNSAISYFDKALLLSPKRQPVLFQMATAQLLKGDAEAAVGLLREAVFFADSAGESHWRLGMALLSAGNHKEAYDEVKRAIDRHFSGQEPQECKKAAALCVEYKDYDCAVREYQTASGLSPDDADIWTQLAILYVMSGKNDLAKEAVLRAVQINPSLQAEADSFLQQAGIK